VDVVRKEEMLSSGMVAFGSDRVVVMHGWYRCCVKHIERIHSFPEKGKSAAESIKGTYTASPESYLFW
jgi:hypothetical protein